MLLKSAQKEPSAWGYNVDEPSGERDFQVSHYLEENIYDNGSESVVTLKILGFDSFANYSLGESKSFIYILLYAKYISKLYRS